MFLSKVDEIMVYFLIQKSCPLQLLLEIFFTL
jgi:hypothetical protein